MIENIIQKMFLKRLTKRCKHAKESLSIEGWAKTKMKGELIENYVITRCSVCNRLCYIKLQGGFDYGL